MRVWALSLLIISLSSCSDNKLIHLQGRTMGTTYNIKYLPTTKTNSQDLIHKTIDQKLNEINQIMSTYIETSELSLINKNNSTGELTVSSELLEVLHMAKNIYRQSDKHFDVTVGPLVNLWGFGPQKKIGPPEKSEIEKTFEFIGMDKLTINTHSIRKKHPKVYIDLSAIAKGYGVDQVASLLKNQFGLENFMVEIGGEMFLKGLKGKRKWKVAIEKPSEVERDFQRIIELSNKAIATSGSYRNFFKYKDKTYSHTINPLTGHPIKHKLVSVTVLDNSSTMRADAWATALSVLGAKKGFSLANNLRLAAYFLYQNDGKIVSIQTEAFSKALE